MNTTQQFAAAHFPNLSTNDATLAASLLNRANGTKDEALSQALRDAVNELHDAESRAALAFWKHTN